MNISISNQKTTFLAEYLTQLFSVELPSRPVNGGPIMGQQSQLNIFSDPAGSGSGFTPATTGFVPFVPTARGPLPISSTGVLPPDQG